MRYFPVIVLLLMLTGCATRPTATVLMAAEAGVSAPDSVGGQPGNPFATAFLELLRDRELTLHDFVPRLRDRTKEVSGGLLSPEVAQSAAGGPVRLAAPKPGEVRVALVIIHSRYTDGWSPLDGAAHDAKRVTEGLQEAGFETALLLDPSRAEREAALRGFQEKSRRSDVAILYTTGHGVMSGETAFLLDSDFAKGWRDERLAEHAIPIAEMTKALRARKANLMLFGGCRTYEWW